MKVFELTAIAMLFTLPVSNWAQTVTSEANRTKAGKIPVLIYRLDVGGLYPTERVTAQGLYYVRIVNHLVPNRKLTVNVDGEASKEGQKEIRAKGTQADVLVNLKKGRHVVSIAEVASWRSTLIVEEEKK